MIFSILADNNVKNNSGLLQASPSLVTAAII